MTYGIRVKNSNGWSVFDGNKTFYHLSSGTTKTPEAVVAQAAASATLDFDELHPKLDVIGMSWDYLGPAGAAVATPGGQAYDYGPLTLGFPQGAMGHQDLMFFDVSSKGLCFQVETHFSFPEVDFGAFGYCVTEDSTGLPYHVASTTPPPVSLGTTHGMRLRDDTGAVIFDSRYPQISVFQTEVITQAQISNVLDVANQSITITLDKSVDNLLVAVPGLFNFRQYGIASVDRGFAFPMLKQTAANKLKITRHTANTKYGTGFTGGFSELIRSYTHDFPILFARKL